MRNLPVVSSRFAHSSISVIIALAALGAYGGCSSSDAPPVTATPDASVDATQPDTSVPVQDAQPEAAPIDDAADDAAEASTIPDDCPDAGDELPTDLACTGLYDAWATKNLAAGVRPYTPGYQLWSDGAIKSRFIYLPPGTKIDTTDMDDWVFPVGTKVWKEFKLGTKRIETRLFYKSHPAAGSDPGWLWTTYRWADDGSKATRLDNGEQNVDGTTYEVPSIGQCQQCHAGRKDYVLGFDAIALGASGAVGVTLASLVAQDWLTTPPSGEITIPEDASGNARAALGWFHANCGAACHNGNSSALARGTGLFLKTSAKQLMTGNIKTEQLDPYVTAVNVTPKNVNYANQGYLRIKPHDVDKSLIPLLDGARNNPQVPEQMPPIVSHMVDTDGLSKVKTWISTMPIPDGGAPDGG